jgi:hypothetical protein
MSRVPTAEDHGSYEVLDVVDARDLHDALKLPHEHPDDLYRVTVKPDAGVLTAVKPKPPKYLAVFCQCGNEVFRTLKRIADTQQNTTPLLAKQALKAHAKRDKCHGRFGKIALVEEAS